MSSPNHIVPSLVQAGSSTTHTTTSYSQHLRSLHANVNLRANVNLHAYLCHVKAHLHAAAPRQA
ncbi:hypothetical protein BDR05DRAFT_957171 [Suillus weaverae]|nr:hypothetical protein BDR05DRAFT_957171 [Suillus weaverae]